MLNNLSRNRRPMIKAHHTSVVDVVEKKVDLKSAVDPLRDLDMTVREITPCVPFVFTALRSPLLLAI